MYKTIWIFTGLILCFSSQLRSQGICNEAGNIILFSNYDGGTLNIAIDENIANIKIALCSYEPLTVNISGAYASNISEVLWAGYTIAGTSVSGVDAGQVNLMQYPPATIFDADGNNNIVCAYECDLDYVPGGCNTVDQATDYFLTNLSGMLRFSYFQYGVWGGTYNISEGGNCCVGLECNIPIETSAEKTVCAGDTVAMCAAGADFYTWSANGEEIECIAPCEDVTVYPTETTTYVVTGTDENGCEGMAEITITVQDSPDAQLVLTNGDLFAYGGLTYEWYLDGLLLDGVNGYTYTPDANGVYSVYVTNSIGCSDWSNVVNVNTIIVSEWNNAHVKVFPNPSYGTIFIGGFSNEIVHYQLLNVAGVVLEEGNFQSNGDANGLNISSSPSGFNVLLLTTKTGTTRHFVALAE